ncbi:MAG: STAS domain-containing protein [Actinobacteria bacterium]|nr:STAS domain-containing protein [Actinomycetota bacterium]
MTPDRSQQPDDASTPNPGLIYVNGTELFSVIVHQASPAAPVVYVAGEIDLLTAPSFQDHLSKLLAHRPECIVIDLSEVSFMGATGLSVLLNARHTGAQRSRPSIRGAATGDRADLTAVQVPKQADTEPERQTPSGRPDNHPNDPRTGLACDPARLQVQSQDVKDEPTPRQQRTTTSTVTRAYRYLLDGGVITSAERRRPHRAARRPG